MLLKKYSARLLALAVIAGISAPVLAQEAEETAQSAGGPPLGFSVGAATVSSNPSYIGMKTDTIAVPFLGYEGEQYFFRGLSLGRHVIRNRQQELALAVTIEPFRFRPQESSVASMQLLDRRGFSAAIGFNYRYNTRYGSFSSGIATDITGRHQGQRLTAGYSLPLNRPGQRWQFAPEIGFTMASSDYVRYYFGVSEQEAERSGLNPYNGKLTFSPNIGAGGYYMINERLTIIGNFRFIRSGSGIVNSPMVSSRSARSFFTAISYRF